MYGTKQQLAKVTISSVNVGGIDVKCVDHVRDLGVLMENNLSFDRHIRKKCQIAHIQLRNLKEIRLNTFLQNPLKFWCIDLFTHISISVMDYFLTFLLIR